MKTHVHESEEIEEKYEASTATRKLPSAQAKKVSSSIEISSGFPAVDGELHDTQLAVVVMMLYVKERATAANHVFAALRAVDSMLALCSK